MKPISTTIQLLILVFAVSTQPLLASDDFKAFGGKEGLTTIVDTAFEHILNDQRINSFFQETDNEFIKEQLVLQFCDVLDGPCKYDGASMKDSHVGLNIKREHFNALVEAVRKSMHTHNVPFASQNRFLAKLAPMHADIIE